MLMAILDDRHYHKKSLIWVNLELEHVINHVLDHLELQGLQKVTKNDYYVSTIQDRDLQQKKNLNTTKIGPILNLSMLLAILSAFMDGSHYQNPQTLLPRMNHSR